jgi:hypothetical protein
LQCEAVGNGYVTKRREFLNAAVAAAAPVITNNVNEKNTVPSLKKYGL